MCYSIWLWFVVRNIAYAIIVVSQFMYAPYTTHLHVVKRIFRYLQGTQDYGYTGSWVVHEAVYLSFTYYCLFKCRLIGCKDSCRSTMGYPVYFGPNLIAWSFKKQPTVSKSSTEAEYDALGYTIAKTVWINLEASLWSWVIIHNLVHLYCDNISVTYMFANPI